jgi:Mlc titration factor MtfA (ptsG expression regulator)
MKQPLPGEWEEIINRRVSYYHVLPVPQQEDLRALIQVFLDEKPFEGCAGLKITDEIRLTISGFACILLLGGQNDLYPRLRTILVYPSGYLAPHHSRQPDGTISEGVQPRSGESWSFGNIVLSWSDIVRDAANPKRGRNIVFHEFAHQLDSESGSSQGAPMLPANATYADWARILAHEYEALINSMEQGRKSLLDEYGAISPAEFFAVVTECFFLKPLELKSEHPKLYAQMELYYRQDPIKYRGQESEARSQRGD